MSNIKLDNNSNRIRPIVYVPIALILVMVGSSLLITKFHKPEAKTPKVEHAVQIKESSGMLAVAQPKSVNVNTVLKLGEGPGPKPGQPPTRTVSSENGAVVGQW